MVNCKTMGKSFDIGLERLTGTGVGEIGETREGGVKPPLHGAGRQDAGATLNASFEEKNRTLKGGPFDFAQDYRCGTHGSEGETFYLETFGCQMNDHDSEKVAGVLLARGYRQVETPEAAKVILYNTCSIREKAAQKVFSRLGELRPAASDLRPMGSEEREANAETQRTQSSEEKRNPRAHAGVSFESQGKAAAQKSAQPGIIPQRTRDGAAGAVPQEAKHPSQRKIVNAGGGKIIGVLGCVAQQEGEGIFERAPYVSLVCGSASYRKLPQMLAQLEGAQTEEAPLDEASSRSPAFSPAGRGISRVTPQNSHGSGLRTRDSQLIRITGLDDRETDECFETDFTAPTNPHRGYITIIEGCDKFCAYCVVPFTRGKERSRTVESVLAEARQMAYLGYTEIQLLGQNVNSYKDPAGKRSFAELLAAVGEVPGIRRVRFTTSHPRDFGRDIVDAIDAVPTLCNHVHLPVQSGSNNILDAMQRLYTREQYLERISWIKSAKRDISMTTDMIVGFPGETESDFAETLSLIGEVGYDSVFTFKYSPRPNTPSLKLEDAIPDEEKARRLEVLMTHQKETQILRSNNFIGKIYEVMVEGKNQARAQYIGRSSQNKTINFTAPGNANPQPGAYAKVRVITAFPNSLLGELVI